MSLGFSAIVTVLEGKVMNLIVMLILFAIQAIPLYLTLQGKLKPQDRIQPLPAVDGIKSSIGRAAEMGRPILVSIGTGASLSNARAIRTQAGLDILSYVTRQSAKTETLLYACTGKAESFARMANIVEESYKMEGRADMFDPNRMYWWSDHYYTYLSGMNELILDTRPAAVMVVGAVSWEAATLSVQVRDMGGITIAGSGAASGYTHEVNTASCDYNILPEEMYAASAYLTRDPIESATILSQDFLKFFSLTLLLIGILLGLFGAGDLLSDFLAV
jgi:hypothetical protein